jgi:hypothetical protein
VLQSNSTIFQTLFISEFKSQFVSQSTCSAIVQKICIIINSHNYTMSQYMGAQFMIKSDSRQILLWPFRDFNITKNVWKVNYHFSLLLIIQKIPIINTTQHDRGWVLHLINNLINFEPVEVRVLSLPSR